MTGNLTQRRATILKIIVRDYITTATPIASDALFRNYNLGVSPATIRNDMAHLEEEGYITRPHTSAGCIPLDRGYRFYVESISDEIELPVEDQRRIRQYFDKIEEEMDRWLKMAAFLLSHLVGNAALVTFPKASECKFKHIELISLHDFLAMMILIFSETLLKQQLITFTEPVTQDELTTISNRLNDTYMDLTSTQILKLKQKATSEEQRITDTVVDIMTFEDEMEYNRPHIEGVRLMLGQPEFVNKERMLDIIEMMEAGDWLRPMLTRELNRGKIQVVIGNESQEQALSDLSLVLGRYGIPQKVGGTLGIIGPTRMDYHKAISTVNYVSDVLSYMVSGIYSEE
jgi:heat-inducible transcriptional repressor